MMSTSISMNKFLHMSASEQSYVFYRLGFTIYNPSHSEDIEILKNGKWVNTWYKREMLDNRVVKLYEVLLSIGVLGDEEYFFENVGWHHSYETLMDLIHKRPPDKKIYEINIP